MNKLKLVFVCALIAPMLWAQGMLSGGATVESIARTYLDNNMVASSGVDMGFNTLHVMDDELGQSHVRFQPVLNGYPVYGHHIIVHMDSNSRQVLSTQGELKTNSFNANVTSSIDPLKALEAEMKALGVFRYELVGDLEPAYLVNNDLAPVFTFTVEVSYNVKGEGPARDRIFLNAVSGDMVARHPQIHTSRNRRTYDANNGTSLPGSLTRTESSGNSGDSCLDAAHNYAGVTYDYYFNTHGRDSLDDNGMTLTSTVHYSSNYNNAYWSGSQMVYGDGDGSTFTCLALDLDVVGHELTHGVTSFTADLVYQNESGALNEATSDIMAAAIESDYEGGVNSNTWKIGEDIYTPNGSSTDALRYMNNPSADGSSTDYYPDRYTGSSDNGGVHWNSGIANLFFYLLSQGGTHPQGKTSNSVTGIGISNAANIWYRALVTYMGPSTTFAQARTHTLQAAADLFGSSSSQYTQVGNAWTAVGVGGSGGGGGGGGALTNGQTETGIGASSSSWVHYYIDVPANATNLTVSMSGGSGDGDLYVRRGAQPTTSTYDCRPYKNGNSESCSFTNPAQDRWYVSIRAYSTFSGVSLTATYTASGGGGGSCGNSGSVSNISASTGNWNYYTFDVDSCATELTVSISGGSGDADLYLRYGSQPTTSSYNCRPYKNGNSETCTISNPTAGTWHIGVRAYSTYSGVTVNASYQ